MDLWDPAAIQHEFPNAGRYLAGPYRLVLHSTEGVSYAGAYQAYRNTGSAPHFTVSYELERFRVYQHIQLDRAAKALEHRTGTVHTNRLSAVQIEIVAFADTKLAARYDGLRTDRLPGPYLEGIADLVGWVRHQCGITATRPEFLPYPASYGDNSVRFSDGDWLLFDGICGHQHVPHQSHGDPGALDVAALLSASKTQTATLIQAPVHDYEEAATKTTMIHIGKLDANGNGWADWQPGLGRDPIIVGLVQLGPSPEDDGYWDGQKNVTLAAQPRGGSVRVTVRNGTPGDTVTAFLTVA